MPPYEQLTRPSVSDACGPLSPATRLDEAPLAFVDVETTGLNPSFGDRICEVAILRCAYGETVARLEQLVNPLRPVSPGAFAVNRITAEMLADAHFSADCCGRARVVGWRCRGGAQHRL